MLSSIGNLKVEGRAASLAAMLKKELAAAHIQKIARGFTIIIIILILLLLLLILLLLGFITRLTRSVPLLKIATIKETIMLSQIQLLVIEEFLVSININN